MNAPHTSPSNVAGWRRRDRITAYTSACPSNTTRPANHANGPFPITRSASTAMARRPPLATAAVRLRPSGAALTASSTAASAPSCQLGASTGAAGVATLAASASGASSRSAKRSRSTASGVSRTPEAKCSAAASMASGAGGSSAAASGPTPASGISTGSEGSSSNRSSAETSSGRSGSASSSSSRPSAISASSSASSTSAPAGPGRSSYAGGALRQTSTPRGASSSPPVAGSSASASSVEAISSSAPGTSMATSHSSRVPSSGSWAAGGEPPSGTSPSVPSAQPVSSSGAKKSSRSSNRSSSRRSRSSGGCPTSSARFARAPLDLQELLLLVRQELVDPGHVLIGELLQLLLRPVQIVLRDLAVLLEPLQLFLGVTADVPHSHLAVLRPAVHDLDQFLAALLGELWERQPDHLAVVRRAQTEVRLHDGLLHGCHGVAVVGLDHQEPGLGNRERRELVQGCGRAVVVHRHPVEDRGCGPAGAHPGELLARDLDGALHLMAGLLQRGLRRHWPDPEWTSVPIRSPRIARRMLPSSRKLNTMIGSPLSIQSEMAVASITCRPLLRTSMYSRSSNFVAPGFALGSAS